MKFELNTLETFALSMVVLFVGSVLSARVPFLRRYNIPEAVVGGLIFSIVVSVLYAAGDLTLVLNHSMMDTMMLSFFCTIGLGANLKLLRRGGVTVLIFLAVCSGFLLIQNGVGVGLAKLMGLDPLIGLLAGSITLTGGHGTGAIWAARFPNVKGALEIAMACATFGMMIGGLVGGPLSQWLIAKHRLAPEEKVLDPNAALKGHGFNEPELVTPKTMLELLFIIAVCLVLAQIARHLLKDINLPIPTFLYSLFIGIFVTNFLEATKIYKMPQQTVDLIGVLSLSIFLTMAMMRVRLWELFDLAGPLFVIMTVQTIAMVLYSVFVTFKVMGRDYESAVMVSGHVGFGLGATTNAMANMEAVIMRYGPAPQSLLIVPLVGAFFIDVVNAGVIQLFQWMIERFT